MTYAFVGLALGFFIGCQLGVRWLEGWDHEVNLGGMFDPARYVKMPSIGSHPLFVATTLLLSIGFAWIVCYFALGWRPQ